MNIDLISRIEAARAAMKNGSITSMIERDAARIGFVKGRERVATDSELNSIFVTDEEPRTKFTRSGEEYLERCNGYLDITIDGMENEQNLPFYGDPNNYTRVKIVMNQFGSVTGVRFESGRKLISEASAPAEAEGKGKGK